MSISAHMSRADCRLLLHEGQDKQDRRDGKIRSATLSAVSIIAPTGYPAVAMRRATISASSQRSTWVRKDSPASTNMRRLSS